jgi:hypothetical protein
MKFLRFQDLNFIFLQEEKYLLNISKYMFLLKSEFYLIRAWIVIREAGEFAQPVQI